MPLSGSPSAIRARKAASSGARTSFGRFRLGASPPLPSKPWQVTHIPAKSLRPSSTSDRACERSGCTRPVVAMRITTPAKPRLPSCMVKRRNFFRISSEGELLPSLRFLERGFTLPVLLIPGLPPPPIKCRHRLPLLQVADYGITAEDSCAAAGLRSTVRS